ncbi:MAG: hypothetical protein HYU43_00915, partial [Armatimonadetes bacterium]|nr:hypothetical protein [Armatimonadota bacterium]
SYLYRYRYTQSYAGLIPGGLKPRPGAPPMRLWFNTGNCLFPDPVFKGIVQPVWTNNEYDMIHALAVEVARTGKSDYLPMLRWSARHTIEVDFVAHCDERMNHRGTPQHSPNHNTSGVISSHLWTQGLLQYYLLTGDRDALDVAHALGEKVMDLNRWSEARSWGFDREIGWGLLSLVCLVEAGFDRYREECIAMSDFLQNYDRRSYRGPVYLSTGRRNRSLERQMVDGGLGYSPLMEAMDRWQKITRRPDTEAWLKELLLQYQRETWNAIAEGEVPHQRYMVPDVMGIGYERTGDRTFIDLGLAILENYDFVREQPVGEIKPSAMTYRAVFRFLGHADRLGLLDSFESPAIVRLRKRAEER